jgi:hypothetical protein
MPKEDWQTIAARVQKERASKIPKEWQLTAAELEACGDYGGLKLIESKLDAKELEITGMSATQVLKVRNPRRIRFRLPRTLTDAFWPAENPLGRTDLA